MSQTITRTDALPIPDSPARRIAQAIVECTKPRITRLVTITTAVGFGVPALARTWSLGELALVASGCLGGTFLSASGANALNQWWERDRDALMTRTCGRPLPQNRAAPGTVFSAGLVLSVAGVLMLGVTCGAVPAMVSLATILIYVLMYTPLKPVTPHATLIGAVPGALPPLIGWTAARGGAISTLGEAAGWSLFALMFVWQVPHFLAIAWMYREDYARGGYRVLPVLDADGTRTASSVVRWGVLLVAATLMPAFLLPGPAGTWGLGYGVVALASGAVFFVLCVRLFRSRTRGAARAVFFASIIHLPLLLVALVADAAIGRLL